MLLFLLIFVLIRALQGTPTSTLLDIPTSVFEIQQVCPRSLSFGRRETHEIVLSCLATIFACTWTAIHPNIPGPTDSGWVILRRRMLTTVYALLAPEIIVMWALQQRLAATAIAKNYNEQLAKGQFTSIFETGQHTNIHMTDPREKISFSKSARKAVVDWFRVRQLTPKLKKSQTRQWSEAHGFFVQMGGFMLCDKGQPVRVLDFFDLVQMIKENKIDAPMTTEAEIKDRSKGDIISKAVVILQTTWFIVQCIARWSSSLPVTELEQVTVAFALLNGITYGVWWNKPQNVGVPVCLELKSQLKAVGEDVNAEDEATDESSPQVDKGIIPKRRHLPRMLSKDGSRHAWFQFWTFDVPYRHFQALLHPLSKRCGVTMKYPGPPSVFPCSMNPISLQTPMMPL